MNTTPKSIEERLPRTYCESGCDGNGTYPVTGAGGDCEPAPCRWCHEVVMPLRETLTTLLISKQNEMLERLDRKARQLDYADRNEFDEAMDIIKDVMKG